MRRVSCPPSGSNAGETSRSCATASTPRTSVNSTAQALVELPRRTVAELLRAVKGTGQPDEAADTLRTIGAGTAGSLGLFLRDQIAKAEFEGRSLDAAELQDQLGREIRRINEDCEEKKERVRAQRG